MTWTNQSRNTSSFSNQTRNTASFSTPARNTSSFSNASRNASVFTALARTFRVFGDLTFDEIGAMTFDGLLNGRPVGDWAFDDLIGPIWTNQSRNL